MTLPLIAIIGTGNMGEALLSGLIASGHPRENLVTSDPSEDRLTQIKARWGVKTSQNNRDAIVDAPIILFAVKPQQLKEVILEQKNLILEKKPLIISIAAGVGESTIRSWLNEDIAIVRAMPNMPALIQTGMTALFANKHVSQENRNLAESVLRAVGVTVWMTEEAQMDIATAVSGSGPAYFFYIMEALQEAGVSLGLSENVARLLTIQTAFGAARMVLESDETLATLCKQVISKGGTTEQAIQIFEKSHLKAIFKDAVNQACSRSQELATLLAGA